MYQFAVCELLGLLKKVKEASMSKNLLLKVKYRVCFAPVFITYNKLYMCRAYIASICFAKLVLHRSSIINKIVINIMIIAVMYTAKSQNSFVDSRRRNDTYGLRSLACVQRQSRTTGDLEYLHGNNRRSC